MSEKEDQCKSEPTQFPSRAAATLTPLWPARSQAVVEASQHLKPAPKPAPPAVSLWHTGRSRVSCTAAPVEGHRALRLHLSRRNHPMALTDWLSQDMPGQPQSTSCRRRDPVLASTQDGSTGPGKAGPQAGPPELIPASITSALTIYRDT